MGPFPHNGPPIGLVALYPSSTLRFPATLFVLLILFQLIATALSLDDDTTIFTPTTVYSPITLTPSTTIAPSTHTFSMFSDHDCETSCISLTDLTINLTTTVGLNLDSAILSLYNGSTNLPLITDTPLTCTSISCFLNAPIATEHIESYYLYVSFNAHFINNTDETGSPLNIDALWSNLSAKMHTVSSTITSTRRTVSYTRTNIINYSSPSLQTNFHSISIAPTPRSSQANIHLHPPGFAFSAMVTLPPSFYPQNSLETITITLSGGYIFTSSLNKYNINAASNSICHINGANSGLSVTLTTPLPLTTSSLNENVVLMLNYAHSTSHSFPTSNLRTFSINCPGLVIIPKYTTQNDHVFIDNQSHQIHTNGQGIGIIIQFFTNLHSYLSLSTPWALSTVYRPNIFHQPMPILGFSGQLQKIPSNKTGTASTANRVLLHFNLTALLNHHNNNPTITDGRALFSEDDYILIGYTLPYYNTHSEAQKSPEFTKYVRMTKQVYQSPSSNLIYAPSKSNVFEDIYTSWGKIPSEETMVDLNSNELNRGIGTTSQSRRNLLKNGKNMDKNEDDTFSHLSPSKNILVPGIFFGQRLNLSTVYDVLAIEHVAQNKKKRPLTHFNSFYDQIFDWAALDAISPLISQKNTPFVYIFYKFNTTVLTYQIPLQIPIAPFASITYQPKLPAEYIPSSNYDPTTMLSIEFSNLLEHLPTSVARLELRSVRPFSQFGGLYQCYVFWPTTNNDGGNSFKMNVNNDGSLDLNFNVFTPNRERLRPENTTNRLYDDDSALLFPMVRQTVSESFKFLPSINYTLVCSGTYLTFDGPMTLYQYFNRMDYINVAIYTKKDNSLPGNWKNTNWDDVYYQTVFLRPNPPPPRSTEYNLTAWQALFILIIFLSLLVIIFTLFFCCCVRGYRTFKKRRIARQRIEFEENRHGELLEYIQERFRVSTHNDKTTLLLPNNEVYNDLSTTDFVPSSASSSGSTQQPSNVTDISFGSNIDLVSQVGLHTMPSTLTLKSTSGGKNDNPSQFQLYDPHSSATNIGNLNNLTISPNDNSLITITPAGNINGNTTPVDVQTHLSVQRQTPLMQSLMNSNKKRTIKHHTTMKSHHYSTYTTLNQSENNNPPY